MKTSKTKKPSAGKPSYHTRPASVTEVTITDNEILYDIVGSDVNMIPLKQSISDMRITYKIFGIPVLASIGLHLAHKITGELMKYMFTSNDSIRRETHAALYLYAKSLLNLLNSEVGE